MMAEIVAQGRPSLPSEPRLVGFKKVLEIAALSEK